ncbi:hypothetical protein Taro_056411, partial [Colocasia esculenta]|nr:hypothetical protein [Colocasia esculenta]
DKLDYANRWRSPHAEPPSHSDRKSCSTRREISSPGSGYGCPNIADIVTPSGLFPPLASAKELGITFRTGIRIAYVTTIRNRHSGTVDKALVSQNSVAGPKSPPERGPEPPARPQFRIGTSTRSVNARIHRFPVRRPNSSPGAWSQAADAIAYGHRFAQTCITFRSVTGIAYKTPIRNRHPEALDAHLLPQAIRPKKLGITFHTGIGIAYVTTIRNRHSETVDKAMVLQNSVSRPKSPSERVRRGYLFARGSEPPARPQFRVGTSTRSVNGRIRRFPVRRQNSSPGARSQAANAIAYGHRFAQTCITFHSVTGIAYKTPIRNRHPEALDANLLPQAIRRRFRV